MDTRNLFVAIMLSIAILAGWSYMFQPKTERNVESAAVAASSSSATPDADAAAPTAQGAVNDQSAGDSYSHSTFALANDVLQLVIDDRGWITQAALPAYAAKVGGDSKLLLSVTPSSAFYVNSGLVDSMGVSSFILLGSEQVGSASVLRLQSTLSDGRKWERTFTLKLGSYSLQVDDRIENGAGLKLYRQVVQRYPNRDTSQFASEVGPVALFDDKLVNHDYDSLDEEKNVRNVAIGGWTGITEQYFIAALYGDQGADYSYYFKGDGRAYQAGMIDNGKIENGNLLFSAHLYLGPKSMEVLKPLGVKLERSVDFGMFSFIAKPLHDMLLWFHKFIPNFGWSIILLVLVIKIVFYIPSKKSYESMAAMRKLQPEQERLRTLYGDDRTRLGQEIMELYKKHKVNPLGGCLPILIQIPVFIALYQVLLVSIEMRGAPFIGWLTDLSEKDPYFILPLLMGASMYIQQKLNPQPPDPIQAKVMQFLPVVFTVMFLFFPSGLVLYWVVNNVLSIVQQKMVMKSVGVS